MAKLTTNDPKPLLNGVDGRALALDLFREICEAGADECGLEEKYRDGRPQNNVMLRYLELLRGADNRGLEAGFAAVVTDYLSSCLDGCDVPEELYERIESELR